MEESPYVFIVDDDEPSREAVTALIRSMGIDTRSFESAEEFLAFYDHQPGCLVADYRMPGMNGLELQETLLEQCASLPVILLTGYARTALTVQAIKRGAVTMLDKPYQDDDLWQAVREALAEDARRREVIRQTDAARSRLASLTAKERQVLDLIVGGQPNKSIATKLDVSLRTVENRRRNVFTKLAVSTVAELVAMVLRLEGSQSTGLDNPPSPLPVDR